MNCYLCTDEFRVAFFKDTSSGKLSPIQGLLILLDIAVISVDAVTTNTLLNKYSRMRSMEENDFTCSKLLGVIYVLPHRSLQVVPGPHEVFEVAAGVQLAGSRLGRGTARDAA